MPDMKPLYRVCLICKLCSAVRRRRAGADVDMLSTKVTIGDEYFASDGVINASNNDVNTGDQIYVDRDSIHSGTAPLGLSITLMFEKV